MTTQAPTTPSCASTTDNNNDHECTSLHDAAKNGSTTAIHRLLQPNNNDKESIDMLDEDGSTPLLVAAEHGHGEVIEMLVRMGSNAIDTPNNNDSNTPFLLAAMNGHVSAIEMLVRLGSNAIDTLENFGRTPLHVAAALSNHGSAIETLVRLGSQAIDTPDNDGCTPLDAALAFPFDRTKSIQTLRALGACHSTVHELSGQPLDEKEEGEFQEIRYRVYFSQSLTHRLLFSLSNKHTS